MTSPQILSLCITLIVLITLLGSAVILFMPFLTNLFDALEEKKEENETGQL
jgi:hypothetical protein